MERQISIRLPVSVLRAIDRRARRRRGRRSDVVREALALFLDLPDGILGKSVTERVPELMGCLKGLPSDLASNPRKYMKDFGRARG